VRNFLSSKHGNPRLEGSAEVWARGGEIIQLSTQVTPKGKVITVDRTSETGRLAVARRRVEFSAQVAHFAFGSSVGQTRQVCEKQAGEFADDDKLRREGFDSVAPAFMCIGPKLDSPLQIKTVTGLFCDGRLCELMLLLGSTQQAALEVLRGKYGPPVELPGAAGKCKPQLTRLTWNWAVGGTVTGWVGLSERRRNY
jgi:hypothetical protein